MKTSIACCIPLLVIAIAAIAQDAPKGKPFSEHGKVISARLAGEAVGSAGVTGTLKRWVYHVDCGVHFYDLQGNRKQSLAIGQDVDFRIEKEKVYLPAEAKKASYRVVGLGTPSQNQPKPN